MLRENPAVADEGAPSVATMFRDAARLHADRAAIVSESGVVTYRRLETDSLRIIGWLAANGIARGDSVAIEGAASPALVAAVLGCLAAGVVFVLIDPALPVTRRAILQREAGVKRTLCPDHGSEFDIHTAGEPPGTDDPAYIFFTSGTTGTPKGVLGRNAGLSHFLIWERQALEVGPGDRVSLLTGLSFDVVLRDMLLPLVSGATLCIPPVRLARDGLSVFAWLEAAGVTLMHTVPSLARAWLTAAAPMEAIRNVKRCLFAGEPLGAELVTDWRIQFPRCDVFNLYGPTETTLAKFWHRVETPARRGIQPCGIPLPDTSVLILDAERRPQPRGLPGEVAIQTRYPSLGYVNAPDQMVSRFVHLAEGAVYLTGDLGFIDADGLLHLQGRIDFQVKINGIRVEPEGIAAELQRHPGVAAAAVVARPLPTGTFMLVAYYVARTQSVGLGTDLAGFLAESLPAAMVPARFVRLGTLPLTPNGKLDRGALPEPEQDGSLVEPRNQIENSVLAVWRRAFDRNDIGVEHNFFELGGDSLTAAVICVMLSRSEGALLSPSVLVDHPTPAGLATILADARPVTDWQIPHFADQPSYPLTPQQRRYYALLVAPRPRNWCNIVTEIEVPWDVSGADVGRALVILAERHDALCMRLIEASGAPWQAFVVPTEIQVPEVELSGDAVHQLRRLRREEAIRPIDPFREPIFRVRLIRLPRRTLLLWNMHHLAGDGRSVAVLEGELQQVIGALRDGRLLEPPPAPPRFRDYALWSNRDCDGTAIAQHRKYWREIFDLPCVRPSFSAAPGGADTSCMAYRMRLPTEIAQAIRLAARRMKTTPFVVLITSFMQSCQRLCGAEDLVLSTPTDGRDHPDFAAMIGLFASPVSIRHRFRPELRFADMAGELQRQLSQAVDHQCYQLDEILRDLGGRIDPDHWPLSCFSINYQVTSLPCRLATMPDYDDLGTDLQYDLRLLVREHPDALALEFHYRKCGFRGDEISRLADCFVSETTLFATDVERHASMAPLPGLDAVRARAFAPY